MNGHDESQDMVARIVAAYASRPDVTPDEIVNLYRRLTGEVHDAPATSASTAAPMAAGGLHPALPVAQSVTEDKVYCLCCGRGFKMLKRHLGAEHGMTEAQYRAAFNLSEDFPLVAPSYSRKKAAHAKEAGLGKYDRTVMAGQE
ncbi:MucR family transcriptional regulator [Alloyangia pacifica]|uniref:Transcriptional regulator, MucR family n=1 Tax=Alloyangia pacifica TaxID=311180 RepID=A0A1I6T190_9RHOB|nr:MucR family transcriptional regulator [Alloyangia pacifica]SDG93424.1 transcriptional regulator, MucR family [Alloyangia pacifica]SFS82777.1 transcriptional regulator, MucR family [Alloyangia pacifica]